MAAAPPVLGYLRFGYRRFAVPAMANAEGRTGMPQAPRALAIPRAGLPKGCQAPWASHSPAACRSREQTTHMHMNRPYRHTNAGAQPGPAAP